MASSNPDLQANMAAYLANRDAHRAREIEALWAGFTARERALIKDAIIMAWIQGSRSTLRGEQWPGDWVAVPTVLGACLSHPDLYQAITGWSSDSEEDDNLWPVHEEEE